MNAFAYSSRIGFYLSLVGLVFRFQRFAEGHGFGGDHVFQRTALYAWEYGGIQQLGHLLDLSLRCLLAPGILEILT